jgi:hypothetical protein
LVLKKKFPKKNLQRELKMIHCLKQIAGTVSVLLEENNIPAGECAGIEIQIPGNADSKKGILINSEIFKWENICISDIIGNIIPLPVNLQGIL